MVYQIACRGVGQFLDRPAYLTTPERAAAFERMTRWELRSGNLDRQTLSFTHLVRIAAAAVDVWDHAARRAGEEKGAIATSADMGCGKGVECWA